MKFRFSAAAILIGVMSGAVGMADQFVVDQKNKKFLTERMTVKVGDTVVFTNSDPVFHNIFSLSEARTFDLGSYRRGEARAVTFDKAGVVQVECAIHPRMYMEIEVVE